VESAGPVYPKGFGERSLFRFIPMTSIFEYLKLYNKNLLIINKKLPIFASSSHSIFL